jgi:hypothetical protein
LGPDEVDLSDLKGNLAHYTPLGVELAKWRRAMKIEKVKLYLQTKQKQDKKGQLCCAVLCSGGCLDTLAAIRAGFSPKWSSEVCAEQAAMFEDLTGGTCLGDTFGEAVAKATWVHYWKSGQPCQNYSSSGDTTREKGLTG